MVLDFLDSTEVLVFVGLVLFGGVLIFMVGVFEFLVHFNDAGFECDELVDGDIFKVGEVFLLVE
jgi:hypothetical protein